MRAGESLGRAKQALLSLEFTAVLALQSKNQGRPNFFTCRFLFSSFKEWPPVGGNVTGESTFGGWTSGGTKGAFIQAEAPGTLMEPGRRTTKV